MPPTRSCKSCGAELPPDASEGLCPRCVAKLAFGDEPPAPQIGAKLRYFGDYELLEEIARGGMGVVFKARQLSLNRVVAVKMILRGEFAGETERQRFRSEAEAVANLQHSNIVAIHEVGEHDGQPYFSMDFVAGRNLAALVKDGPLPSLRAASYLKPIAEAIHYAHQKGTLHRDLKPSNVLIDEFDAPRITDFGLAKRLNDSEVGTRGSELTQTGQVLGTPSFAAPEQIGGRKEEIGPRSEVYSLGALLYFLLTGQPPFTGKNLEDTLSSVLHRDATSPRRLNSGIPPDLETICLKCLEKNPSQRYASAQEMADELARFLRDEPIVARPIGWSERSFRLVRRHRLVTSFALAAGILAATVALLLWERKAGGNGVVTAKPMPSLPIRSGNGISGLISDTLYVATPFDGKSGHRTSFHAFDFKANTWQQLPDTPAVFLNAAAGVIGETFFVAGGETETGVTNSTWAFDPRTRSWSPKAPMPTARAGCAAAVLDGRLYVIGGHSGTNVIAIVESYDPKLDRWQAETAMPTARMYCGGAAMNGSIFVVGGDSRIDWATNQLATVESWRPGQAWVTQSSLPTPVSHAFVGVVGNTLYTAGGKANFSETDELQAYTAFAPGRFHWIPLRPMPEVRYQGSGALARAGKLYLIGGWNDLPDTGKLPYPDVFIYDTQRNAWARSK